MNTLEVESKLAQKYKYKPLPNELSKKYRAYFKSNTPTHLQNNANKPITTSNGSTIAHSYNRIVIGDYGAFIEFNKEQANRELFIVAPVKNTVLMIQSIQTSSTIGIRLTMVAM